MVLPDPEIEKYLKQPHKFAIVGASTNQNKPSNYVPRFLKSRGWTVIPINPRAEEEIFGMKPLASLDDLTEKVDGVIIYRAMPAATEFIELAVDKKIPMIWLPEKVVSSDGEKLAENAGLKYVHDKCPKRLIEEYLEEGIWEE